MTFFKRWLIIKLCILMVMPMQAWPQALPDRVGRAISGTMQDGMRSRGFAANDPRFGNTLARVTPQLAVVAGGTVGAVTVGAVTAPAWATVAIGLVVGAVITYAVNLALNGLVNWLFRSDEKIDEYGEPLTVPTSTAMIADDAYWRVSFHSGGVNIELAGGDGEALARQGHYEYLSQTGQNNQTAPSCSVTATHAACGIIYAYKQSSGAPASCPAGSMFKSGVCGPYTFVSPAATPSKTGLSLQQAVDDIPAADLNKPLNPAIVAAMANQAWQQAASQPGYDGLPYPQSNPITAPEAATWANANPMYAPTVRDFVSPNPATTAQPQPWALPQNPTAPVTSPATTPNANTANPASQNPQENLGPDPGIGAPTLEPIPTAQQIMQPILDLAPGLQNFQATSQSGTCPRPTFDLVGRTLTLEAHCTLIDQNKQLMQAAMVFAWAALALFIILSA